MELAKEPIVNLLLGIDVRASELIEPPQETLGPMRSDVGLKAQLADKSEIVLILEFQSYWREEKLPDLAMYAIRHDKKYGLPVRPVMFLFTPNGRARDVWTRNYLWFKFDLIRMWELNASDYFDQSAVALLPLVGLMKGGIEMAPRIERAICECQLAPIDRSDLLTIFSTLLGLRDLDVSNDIRKRRRELMIESPFYKTILDEGREEGCRKTLIKAIKMALDIKFGDEACELFPDIEALSDSGILDRIHSAIKPAKNLEEIRQLMKRLSGLQH